MRAHTAREASAFTKFRLLMWKNFLQQWRHKGQTLAELLLPVLTMALVLILRWQLEPRMCDAVSYPPIPANSLAYSKTVLPALKFTELSIAYSPQSPILDDVVRSAISKLMIENARDVLCEIRNELENIFPDWPYLPDLPPCDDDNHLPIQINSTQILDILKNLIVVIPYNSSKELKGIYFNEEETRKVIAAVEFDDDLFGTTLLPTNISYSLRFPEKPRQWSLFNVGGMTWRTELLFPIWELPGPRFPYSWEGGNDPGYVNEMFIALQQVISSEIISRLTGINVDEHLDVNIQRYPHPEYIEDYAVELLQLLFPSFIMLSFAYTATNIVRAVTVEKELQLKESMKIMGLPTWLHWTAWFFKQFLYLTVTAILITIIIKVNWFTNEHGFSEYAVFTNTPASILIFFLLLYLSCTIFFCFMISGFFSKASTAALFTGLIWFITNIPAALLYMDVQFSVAVQTFSCLSINSAMSYGFNLLIAKEATSGMQWGSFFESSSLESSRFTFGHVVVMLAVDCVVYFLIALYLEQVLPGPYGTPRPWYFLFQKQFWMPNKKKNYNEGIFDDTDNLDKPMEKDPNLPIGVQMKNLTKEYGNNTVVNNLSLNIYEDQITVLLGHNGAGKSTTISMLTGNVEITHGTVNLAGYDITQNPSAARAHLGLCPQHNVIFNSLTVREHLIFFARLKGYSGKELDQEIEMLIEKLELQEKRDYLAQGLSGGQKRRLCVGIALSGAAKVVLLDEPTSGMDPASRRGLWDLLQKEKKGRSMILTTHFMDEADILGDRVAIMASGSLQCVGSPFYLKRHYGVGYTMVVVKDEGFQYEACTQLVNSYIPGIIVKEDRGSEVTYSLTNDYSHLFENLLQDLENNKDRIKYKNYGLTATTLEDVFMSVGSDTPPVQADSDDTTVYTDSSEDLLKYEFESSFEQLDQMQNERSWLGLTWQHMCAMWFKLWLVWSRSWGVAMLQLFVPIFILTTTLLMMEYMMSFVEGMQKRPLSLNEGYIRTETFLHYSGSSMTSLGYLAKQAYERMFSDAPEGMDLTYTDVDIEEYYLNRTSDPFTLGLLRNRLLIGASFAEATATAWFSNFGYHDVATSLAALHNAVLQAALPAAELRVANHPLDANYNNQGNIQMTVSILSMQMSSGIGNSLTIVSAFYIMFYIRERACRAKLLQKAAGIAPATMWGAAAVFDLAWFLLVCLTIPIICAIFQVTGMSSFVELGRFYVCLIVYGFAMLPLNYLLSHVFKGPAIGFVTVFFINVLFGMIGSQVVEALNAPMLTTQNIALGMDYVLEFFPLYALITAVKRLHTTGITVATCLDSCERLQAVLPNVSECTMDVMCQNINTCCVRPDSQWEWEAPGVLRYLLVMLLSGVLFYAVLFAIEYRIFHRLFHVERRPPAIDPTQLDDDVAAEIKHVQMMDETTIKQTNMSLLVKDLSKYYGKNLAVDQLSFSVSPGEIFGLLGVNGAGKTTTFKMLMGDERASSGDAFVAGHSVTTALNRVHSNIGYCPQFDALFEELSGRECLRLFAALRGLRPPAAAPLALLLAQALGFTKHLDKRVSQYSGGNKRKLSTAVALLGNTRLVSVDEPTTGVDPAAKRQVWRALRGARAARRGILLTSHSMEECEALCSRLAIMVNGRFQCLGTPQHLKNKFSEGFTLTVKMKLDENSTDIENATQALKDYINSNFTTPKIIEEYQGLLTYYLPDRSVPWSRMFGTMERAKQQLAVEDYSITQTTLEQIFLQFTKYQRL